MIFLLHAILSCPILKICVLIRPTKWSHKSSQIWDHLAWGYIAKDPTTELNLTGQLKEDHKKQGRVDS